MRKKIIMFFGKEKFGPDPFFDYGSKRSIYYYFFEFGRQNDCDMFLVSGKEKYLGNMEFKNPLSYNGYFFEQKNEIIKADAIFDRSATMQFPPKEIALKVLNCLSFKIICNSKLLMRDLLGNFMPKSFVIKNKNRFAKTVRKF